MKRAFLSSFFASGLLLACNAQIAQVLESEDAGTSPAADAGPAPYHDRGRDAALPEDAGFGPIDGGPITDGGKVACTLDHECNFELTMSALAGKCWNGICICDVGYFVQPNGKCGKDEPGDCATQGGTCRTNPSACQTGELETHFYTSMKCGDIQPFQCCVPAANCYAPVDIVCCGAAAQYYEPTCVNGWRTCAGGGPEPRLRSQGCL
jgi:hypothetical protein